MLRTLHDALHRLLDTRTKKACAITALYALTWLAIYDVLPAPDSLAVMIAGSRESARYAANHIMEALFWITLAAILLVGVMPAKTQRARMFSRRR